MLNIFSFFFIFEMGSFYYLFQVPVSINGGPIQMMPPMMRQAMALGPPGALIGGNMLRQAPQVGIGPGRFNRKRF